MKTDKKVEKNQTEEKAVKTVKKSSYSKKKNRSTPKKQKL